MRDVLGPEVPITDREIEDSLWHYYYDIDKTVHYLLSMTLQTVILLGVADNCIDQRTKSQTAKKAKNQKANADINKPDGKS